MRLDATDRFAVVSYDQQIDVVIDSTTATAEAKQMALARLRAIDARGSTDLAEGWLRGSEQVALGLTDDAIGRCLLLTDGLANVGIKDPAILRTHATELRARRITTTTFGVGTDFDEVLLQSMADAGAGHYYYIDSVARIPDFMASEVGEALETVARDAVIAAHTPDVLVEPIGPLAFTRAGDATLVHLGDLVSGQVLEVVLKLTFPVGTDGAERQVAFRLADRDGVLGGASATISWRYASHAENDAQRGLERRPWRSIEMVGSTKQAAPYPGWHDGSRTMLATTRACALYRRSSRLRGRCSPRRWRWPIARLGTSLRQALPAAATARAGPSEASLDDAGPHGIRRGCPTTQPAPGTRVPDRQRVVPPDRPKGLHGPDGRDEFIATLRLLSLQHNLDNTHMIPPWTQRRTHSPRERAPHPLSLPAATTCSTR